MLRSGNYRMQIGSSSDLTKLDMGTADTPLLTPEYSKAIEILMLI